MYHECDKGIQEPTQCLMYHDCDRGIQRTAQRYHTNNDFNVSCVIILNKKYSVKLLTKCIYVNISFLKFSF